MSCKITELNATVLEQTKKLLEETSEKMGMPVGMILDRLVLKACPEDPQDAANLILDYICICSARLNPEAFNETIHTLVDQIESTASNDYSDLIKEKIYST